MNKIIVMSAIIGILALSVVSGLVISSAYISGASGNLRGQGIFRVQTTNGQKFIWDVFLNKTDSSGTYKFYLYTVVYYSNTSQVTLPNGNYEYYVTANQNDSYEGEFYFHNNVSIITVTF